ncbi:MAG: hypothetical protein J0H85_13665 [Sediminibacterium magnilacihabitans]|jgi:hypothetical protein|nr:hypothetical protein [Sediminibacterium magnilacihabitans]PQV59477.1 hypothetical protein CLV53_11838 [Sediminibacterium magnilacihabitans]
MGLVDASDDSSYESSSKSIFEEAEILNTKALQRIQMRLQTVSNSKNIEVQFSTSLEPNPGDNYAIVSGDDSVWVNGVLFKLSECINSAQEQPSIVKHLGTLQTITVITFLIIYFRIWYDNVEKLNNDWIRLLFFVVLPFIILLLSIELVKYLKSMWPDMELQTGPNYSQIPSKKREKVKWIVTIIVVPLLVGFVYDILKNWLRLFK